MGLRPEPLNPKPHELTLCSDRGRASGLGRVAYAAHACLDCGMHACVPLKLLGALVLRECGASNARACRMTGPTPVLCWACYAGDHALTGLAIGKMLGIAGNNSVITGPEIDRMTDERLRMVRRHCVVTLVAHSGGWYDADLHAVAPTQPASLAAQACEQCGFCDTVDSLGSSSSHAVLLCPCLPGTCFRWSTAATSLRAPVQRISCALCGRCRRGQVMRAQWMVMTQTMTGPSNQVGCLR